MNAAFQRVECPRWVDLIRAFENLEGWMFRGHASANWSLQSTLERRTPAGDRKLHTEYNLVREFQRRAHNYLGAHQIPAKAGEWLALMQHFGAPTRLVDFTYSPFVAAYFAFEELPADGCSECAIVAISPAWCHSQLGALALAKGGLFGYDLADIRAGVTGAKAGPPLTKASDAFVAGALLSGYVDVHAQSSTHAMIAVFDPERLTERMSAQQGVFLWPGNPDLTVMQNLLAFENPTVGVQQLIVPVSERGRALEQLRLMNITRTSLFPGLEGFAQSFRQLPVREPMAARGLRAALRGLENAFLGPRTDRAGEQE